MSFNDVHNSKWHAIGSMLDDDGLLLYKVHWRHDVISDTRFRRKKTMNRIEFNKLWLLRWKSITKRLFVGPKRLGSRRCLLHSSPCLTTPWLFVHVQCLKWKINWTKLLRHKWISAPVNLPCNQVGIGIQTIIQIASKSSLVFNWVEPDSRRTRGPGKCYCDR